MSKLEPTRTCSNPTANGILRRMLDERGVEWWEATPCKTKWNSPIIGGPVAAREWNGEMVLDTGYIAVTPAQAIAATLGATDAKPTRVESSGTCEADETDMWECVRDDLGGYGKKLTVHVMECTECGHVYEHVNGDYEYCPRCGRKRRDVEE